VVPYRVHLHRRVEPRVRRWHRRAWAVLIVALAAMVPLSTIDAVQNGIAFAIAPPLRLALPVAPPALPPVAVTRDEAGGVQLGLEDAASESLGSPNGGRLVNGVRLPASGVGYYTYDPRTQEFPGGAETRFGTAGVIREMLMLGRWWAATYPDAPRLGIGDLSRRYGGPIDGHASHQSGLDVDIRLPRRDGVEGPATQYSYDRGKTQALVDRLNAQGATLILKGYDLSLDGPVVNWPNHNDHLHVRFGNSISAG
jgi:hypothetical protein